ncbi:MAG: NAD(P)/FAD-dependent oxidoreductase [Defluviitaleaceae bacterium]|nr:NAD(P)/FAD-dependent oxidoreductase [Defluviitaleaceae bacterium]
MKKIDLIIIGGGPAGLSAAIKAREEGIQDILVVERNKILGGILNQCIHNGFGLHVFKEELTGPEYAHKLIERAKELQIPFLLETMVLDITPQKQVKLLSTNGVETIEARAIILAMGCRERPRGAINIPGDRPSGIFSAGTAQELVNMRGLKIGKTAVIVGSGDIGLIMARRLTLEGMDVKAVVELMPFSGGLRRNIAQCLDDFNIPLHLSHTVTKIVGKERLESIIIAAVDENRNPIPETERLIECDTLLFSVGLIPESELAKAAGVALDKRTNGAIVDNNLQTTVEGIFSCGNTLHVHDLVDDVTFEAYEAAVSAKKYLQNNTKSPTTVNVPVVVSGGVRYAVPQNITDISQELKLKFRVGAIYEGANVNVFFDNEQVYSKTKKILTPGEMEIVTLSADIIAKLQNVKEIRIDVK